MNKPLSPKNHPDDHSAHMGMVLKGYPRISETFISNEIRLLESQGFSIHILSMRAPREDFTHASIREIKALVTYLPEYLLKGLPALLWHNFFLFLARPKTYLGGVGLLLRRFRLAPKKHTWLKHFLQAGYLVRKGFGRQPAAHLHAHFAHTPCSVAMYASVLSGAPFSFTAHAKDIYTQDPRRLREKIARAAFVITCTRHNQEYLRTLAPEGKPIHCVYHGIDLSLFNGDGREHTAEPPYEILTVARMVEKKGLDTVLRALALLRDQGVEFRYTLVGDGPLKKSITALVTELGLTGQVSLKGTVTHDQVLALLRQAHCFTLGCRVAADGDRDGIPNVIAEAMAMGVPVAATTVSGIPELVEQGKTGLLAEPDDPSALAKVIMELLADQELRARVIPSARAKVEQVFDNKALVQDLADIYRSMGVGPGQPL